jgi:hypothetical protein
LLREDAMAFDDVYEANACGLPWAGALQGAPAEVNASGVPRQQSGHGAQQRCLAGAVWPKQCDHLAGANDHVDAVQHDDLAVSSIQALHVEQRFSRRDMH